MKWQTRSGQHYGSTKGTKKVRQCHKDLFFEFKDLFKKAVWSGFKSVRRMKKVWRPYYCCDCKVEHFTEYQAEIKFGLIQRNFAFICIIILSNLWKTNTVLIRHRVVQWSLINNCILPQEDLVSETEKHHCFLQRWIFPLYINLNFGNALL